MQAGKRPAIIKGDIALIPLGANAKDGYAIVDKEFAHLADKNWCMHTKGYVVGAGGRKRLHRVIMNTPPNEQVDHINGNKLDNRIDNLRNCTAKQNSYNNSIYSNNTSGYKGVVLIKTSGKFRARIRFNNKYLHIGCFNSAIEAAKAYNKKATELFGEFARVN